MFMNMIAEGRHLGRRDPGDLHVVEEAHDATLALVEPPLDRRQAALGVICAERLHAALRVALGDYYVGELAECSQRHYQPCGDEGHVPRDHDHVAPRVRERRADFIG